MSNSVGKKVLKVAAALMLCAFLTPAAQAKKCTREQADAADAMVDHLDSWEKINQARKQIGQCDQGSISQGLSEAVARALVDKWDTLPTLAKLIKQDRALKPFVLGHLNTTLNGSDMEQVQVLATSSCPPALKGLCTELKKAAKAAMY